MRGKRVHKNLLRRRNAITAYRTPNTPYSKTLKTKRGVGWLRMSKRPTEDPRVLKRKKTPSRKTASDVGGMVFQKGSAAFIRYAVFLRNSTLATGGAQCGVSCAREYVLKSRPVFIETVRHSVRERVVIESFRN